MVTTFLNGSLARLEEESLSQAWLAARLGIPSARIDALRRAGELLGVRPPGRWEHLYPAWQFDAAGTPLPRVSRVVRAGRDAGLDEAAIYELLTRRAGLTSRRTLVDAIRDGAEEHVLAAIRRFDDHGLPRLY